MDELSKFIESAEEEVETTEVIEDAVEKKGKKKGKKAKEKKAPKPKRDNIAYVQGLNSIASVRKFYQTAVAKRAKSIGKDEAVARYEAEMAAAKERLEQLLLEAEESDNVLLALLERDEEPNKILTYYIKSKEAEFKQWVEDNEFKVPKSALKNITDEVPSEFLQELPLDLHEAIFQRHEKMDFRLRAICRTFNFVAAVEAGRIINKDGKWVTEGPEVEAE